MDFFAGHSESSRIVHLTRASFFTETLCGETVGFDGEPDLAVICDACDRLGREVGGDPDGWIAVAAVRVELRAAA